MDLRVISVGILLILAIQVPYYFLTKNLKNDIDNSIDSAIHDAVVERMSYEIDKAIVNQYGDSK